jgi:hypothetical protein
MNSSGTTRFWREFFALPWEMQQRVRKAYRLWRNDPSHPSLRFEAKGDYWTVRIDRGWRVIGRKVGDTMYWLTIQSHDGYERFLKRR